LSLSPIVRALSTIQKRQVRFLLMGGQACILYGGAEFSRDLDLAVLAEARNLERLRHAPGHHFPQVRCPAPRGPLLLSRKNPGVAARRLAYLARLAVYGMSSAMSVPPMSEVTHILSAIEQGDP
jgi:hypothetical protein